MQKFPSSIFSSETLQADVVRTGAVKATILALLITVLAETACRWMLEPIGRRWEYWDPVAADKFEYYRSRLGTNVPDVVIVGDSTAARNFSPEALEAKFALGTDVFNLGWPGNFPMAFRHSTMDLFGNGNVPRLVIVSFSPSSFVNGVRVSQIEDAILGSPFCRHSAGETSIGQYVYLSRLRDARPFAGAFFTGLGLNVRPADDGAMLLDGRKETVPQTLQPPSESGLSDARLNVLDEFVQRLQNGGSDVLLVLPPAATSERLSGVPAAYLAHLNQLCDQSPHVTLFNSREDAQLDSTDFWDAGHLNRAGATKFSKRIGAAIAGNNTPPAVLIRSATFNATP